MKKTATKELALIALFAVFTAALSQLSIYLPFSPVPFSMGIIAVFITGLMLKPKLAFSALLVYLMLGAVGAPVFSGFRGGFSVLIGPTGGFLFAYPFMAVFISLCTVQIEKNPEKKRISFVTTLVILTLSLVICYGAGASYLSVHTHSFSAALKLAVYPFVVFDMIKVIFCALLIPHIKKRLSFQSIL